MGITKVGIACSLCMSSAFTVPDASLRGASSASFQEVSNLTLELRESGLQKDLCAKAIDEDQCWATFGFVQEDCACHQERNSYMWVCAKRFGQTIANQFCSQRVCEGCQLPVAAPAPAIPPPLPPGVIAPAPPIPPAIPGPVQPATSTSQRLDTATTTAQPPATTPSPPSLPNPSTTFPGANGIYRLDWVASGKIFFDQWDFLTDDGNHGSADYVDNKAEAESEQVALGFDSHAILCPGRVSPKYKYKRLTGKIGTKKSWTYFLAAMRYTHLPFGCGVWPAFYTLASHARWPDGGETDILEYVNDQASKTSFHTSQNCTLDTAEVSKYGYMRDYNDAGYNCLTRYCAECKTLGCAPNKDPLRTGEQWSGMPGVFAMEHTEAFIKIFYIPEQEIPADLSSDRPRTETWDRWIISYYPFQASEQKRPGSCPMPERLLAPQKLILGINFCGDWASKVWGESSSCASHVGPAYGSNCRAVDPLAEYAPDEDCCTQFIWDENRAYGTDSYLQSRAFFNISWVKVFVH